MPEDHKLEISEQAEAADNIGGDVEAAAPKRKTYIVTAENGLFKNGKQYEEGDEIELDPTTAGRFKDIGEVKDAE